MSTKHELELKIQKLIEEKVDMEKANAALRADIEFWKCAFDYSVEELKSVNLASCHWQRSYDRYAKHIRESIIRATEQKNPKLIYGTNQMR